MSSIHELNLLRLSNVKQERNELVRLKSKFKLFDINRFTLNKEERGKYRRNISIVKKLNKLMKFNFNIPFQIYINNVKKERELFNVKIIYLKKICKKYNIPDDLLECIKIEL